MVRCRLRFAAPAGARLSVAQQSLDQPVAKANRKCQPKRKGESGAFKILFFGSESVLLHSTLER